MGSFEGTTDGGDNNIGGVDTTNGFVAQKNARVDPNGSPFELIGMVTVGAGGETLNIVLTRNANSDVMRADAIGIQRVGEATE